MDRAVDFEDDLQLDTPGATADVLRDRRILVVEDEAMIAMMLEDDLVEAGATVLGPVATVAAAIRLIEEAIADGGLHAAVLDLNLGGERAKPVADRLASRGVPFLFATGYGVGCDTGGHDSKPMLHKPFSAEQIVSIVGDLTRRGRDHDGIAA
jgi:DNA-binding response OmpR family regulator